jgi:hypothetical protein
MAHANARLGPAERRELVRLMIDVAHSTVHAILRRHGRSRTLRSPRDAFKRYEWPWPATCCTWTSSAKSGALGDCTTGKLAGQPRFPRRQRSLIAGPSWRSSAVGRASMAMR